MSSCKNTCWPRPACDIIPHIQWQDLDSPNERLKGKSNFSLIVYHISSSIGKR